MAELANGSVGAPVAGSAGRSAELVLEWSGDEHAKAVSRWAAEAAELFHHSRTSIRHRHSGGECPRCAAEQLIRRWYRVDA